MPLNHEVLGPRKDGRFFVAYQTPGCSVMTIVCDCRTEGQAAQEAERLNREQVAKEVAIEMERRLCGFRRMVFEGLR